MIEAAEKFVKEKLIMKKIVCMCICIFLASGCGKLPNHGRPANTVVEDKGSEGVSTHSLTSNTPKTSASESSNTPAPTPEPSKSAPSSDSAVSSSLFSWHFPTININNSVAYWALSAVVYATIAVGCVALYRLVSPLEGGIIKDYDDTSGYINVPFEEIHEQGYRIYEIAHENIISYTWYIFKKVALHVFYRDIETKEQIKGVLIFWNDNCESLNPYSHYLYKPAPDQ